MFLKLRFTSELIAPRIALLPGLCLCCLSGIKNILDDEPDARFHNANEFHIAREFFFYELCW